ncbi:hypothetical protein ElyMa_003611700 [Elysia marginata]|uniref:Uncharacterized protein n=1 Tax=Elysia marginata TaxID=1093978 RepID=A0AAV4ET46_9GAST|nr:hypothetical protein ElyMa_003611700 [Elysia marginata]
MPQQTSTFESHFSSRIRVLDAHITSSSIACSWVLILQVDRLGKLRVNCFPKAIATWQGQESNLGPPDHESVVLTTLPEDEKINFTTTSFMGS